MIEKVNPHHPDKVADRIAGAIVDIAYAKQDKPRIAVEVLLGHGQCHVIIESSVRFDTDDIVKVVNRITMPAKLNISLTSVSQDTFLAGNQKHGYRCGDNGIFKGSPITAEQMHLVGIACRLYDLYPADGKYILDEEHGRLIICQSNAKTEDIRKHYPKAVINPLGEWTGGSDVDAGATNRKLGSDMFDGVTGGGLHGKDLSKADVSVNIWCFLQAQERGEVVTACCAIGDETVHTSIGEVPFGTMVKEAKDFIHDLGGFEKFAEWGLF